jgi:lysophospholipase L1-like esterase
VCALEIAPSEGGPELASNARQPSSRRRDLLVNISLVLASTALALVVALPVMEVVLRIVSPLDVFTSRIPLRPHYKRQLRVNIPGISPIGMHSTNGWGLRGDEPPADWKRYYTIVTVGGSTTHCLYLDDHKTWSYLLQEDLRLRCPKSFNGKCPKVWVGNGGICGQSSRAHIMFMEDVISKIRPDAVIVLVGVNDLAFSLSRKKNLYGNEFDRLHWKMWLYVHSRLVQVLYDWKCILLDKVHVVKTLTSRTTYHPKPLTGKTMKLPDDLRTLLVALDDYRKNVRQIIAISRRLKVRAIFMTQPSWLDDTEYWRTIDGDFYWVKEAGNKRSAATICKLLDIYNKELMTVCSAEGVECFDLASAIPHDRAYFFDPVHFTEKGAQLVAQKITDFLNR